MSDGYKERCIHSEVLKAYPGVNSVIHSHSEAVLPYGISGVEMKPCFHFAGFLGTWSTSTPHMSPVRSSIHPSNATSTTPKLTSPPSTPGSRVPTFNIANHCSFQPHNFLVSTPLLGAALASYFTTNPSAPSFSLHPTPTQTKITHPVVLMRGHGFTNVGANLQEAVFRAVYTQQNTRVQTEAMVSRSLHTRAKERVGVVYNYNDERMMRMMMMTGGGKRT